MRRRTRPPTADLLAQIDADRLTPFIVRVVDDGDVEVGLKNPKDDYQDAKWRLERDGSRFDVRFQEDERHICGDIYEGLKWGSAIFERPTPLLGPVAPLSVDERAEFYDLVVRRDLMTRVGGRLFGHQRERYFELKFRFTHTETTTPLKAALDALKPGVRARRGEALRCVETLVALRPLERAMRIASKKLSADTGEVRPNVERVLKEVPARVRAPFIVEARFDNVQLRFKRARRPAERGTFSLSYSDDFSSQYSGGGAGVCDAVFKNPASPKSWLYEKQ